jgi:hypothetical protein
VWYEIARAPSLFEDNQKCITTQYVKKENGLIDVNISGDDINSHTTKMIKGDALLLQNGEGKLGVCFIIQDSNIEYNLRFDFQHGHLAPHTTLFPLITLLHRCFTRALTFTCFLCNTLGYCRERKRLATICMQSLSKLVRMRD